MKLLVTLTFNKSLKDWYKEGTLNRELKYYKKLSNITKLKISFFSYGDESDKLYIRDYKNFEIINIHKKKRNFHNYYNFFYSIIFLLINFKLFKSFQFIKTNQNHGSWIGVILKILNPNTSLISRGGYDLYHFKSLEKNLLNKILSYFICFMVYKVADKIFVPSNFYYDFIIKRFNLKKKKVIILPNYIDIDLFKIRKSRKLKNKILFVGRFIDQKNLFNIIEIFSNTKYELDFIGDGYQKNDLLLYAKINNCKLNIKNPVKNEKLPFIMNKYNFFILNSHFEGNPKVLLEAMSSELVCIANNAPGINNIIEHKKNGFLIDKNNNEKFNLFSLLENKYLLDLIKKNSRNFIIKNHSFKTIVNIESNVYM
tara:strand:- start:5016 stop:6122 length:1107 start_codon:yes stop_codon:yes gene_type:complete